MKLGIVDMIELRVVPCFYHHRQRSLDADNMAAMPCYRQREITQATEQIEHTVGFTEFKEIDCGTDHAAVDNTVDLGEVRRLEFDAHIEFVDTIKQRFRRLWPQWHKRIRLARLKHHREIMLSSECRQHFTVRPRQFFKMAKYQHHLFVTRRNFDLRQLMPEPKL